MASLLAILYLLLDIAFWIIIVQAILIVTIIGIFESTGGHGKKAD